MTNLTFDPYGGTIEFWFAPDWDSGVGPGEWGRLIDIGAYSTNSPSSWCSLYFDPQGTNLYFSSETDGVFTNYLYAPIAWTANTWHLIDLTYSHFQSLLYVDGQLVTNGTATAFDPTGNAFHLGSDATGTQQARGRFDDLATYNYPLSALAVADNYTMGYDLMNDITPPPPDTNNDDGGAAYEPPDYGTNLWLATLDIVSNTIPLVLSNTPADVLYEIQGRTNLGEGDWFSLGFVSGSELTNWTAANVPVSKTGNLFLRIRSWQDTTGTGIPDWWWLMYEGQTTNVDAYALDPANDGLTFRQKYNLGVNPNDYYNPNALAGFAGCLDATGTNVFLEWNPGAGPVTYSIQRGIEDTNGNYIYTQIGEASSNATFFEDAGVTNNNPRWQNNIYHIEAMYPNEGIVASNAWYAWQYAAYGYTTPPGGVLAPGNVYAYADAAGTNVSLSWTPAGATATNYIVLRGVLDTNTYDYNYTQIASLDTNTTYFNDVGAIQSDNDWNDAYKLIAVYPGGGLSQPKTSYVYATPPPINNLSVTFDSTGTNALISWTPLQGIPVSHYVIRRGVLNTDTGDYDYTQIGEVNGNTTSFEDTAATQNGYNKSYQVEGLLPDGNTAESESEYLPGSAALPTANLNFNVQLVRNETGRWQLVFSGIPSNVQAFALNWNVWGEISEDVYPDPDLGYPFNKTTDIPVSSLTNGIYVIPDAMAIGAVTPGITNSAYGNALMLQAITADGVYGNQMAVGSLAADEPAFVDGRETLKQNLLFQLRNANIFAPNVSAYLDLQLTYFPPTYVITNYTESGFISAPPDGNADFAVINGLLPLSLNYQYHGALFDTNYSGATSFTWDGTLSAHPATNVLDISDPYWIFQDTRTFIQVMDGGVLYQLNATFLEYVSAFGAYTDTASLYLESGVNNLFGLPYETALVNSGIPQLNPNTLQYFDSTFTTLAPGDSADLTNVDSFYSQTADPQLQLKNYYFAPVNILSGATQRKTPPQPYPIPSLLREMDDWYGSQFATTNQTGVLIASVGQPTVIGGWAKFGIENGYSDKFAYLGQYFVTNAYAVSNGVVVAPTNQIGVVSPYGDFFPMQGGQAALITMPDPDSEYAQGTAVVDVVSLNVDANHDGAMDFSYFDPDSVSASHPFRFWVNDVNDAGDYGGDGIPGGNGSTPDGTFVSPDGNYSIQGSRNLINFFPVYLNIGSLFQSSALSAGISPTDTNYQFVLSQADGALRFAYTDLMPTNYMNFLLDTNEVFDYLHDTSLNTVSNANNGGTPVASYFLSNLAYHNGGIILVEAWTNTTQPLVLTIYHGTNQIAQTSLPLSITGVEQMFRSKTILLNSDPRSVPDRLTDADVPNEPDTSDVNFIFVHGYNVNPQEARGNFADVYKRLYWSGSHAKFYGVTWEGSDSQGNLIPGVTANYDTNVVNAFNTAPLLNNFLNSLSGTNVVAAHSLGNMLVLSTLNDYSNQTINTYFMIDAAVPLEAVEGIGTNQSLYLTHSSWTDGAISQYGASYGTNLWASYWHNLFPTNDYRSQLTWDGRLANLQNADVYNFYSSGEEVLRTYTTRPTPSFTGFVLGAVYNQIAGIWSANGAPVSSYVWDLQELLKGRMDIDTILGSSHGGWQFSFSHDYLVTNDFGTLVFMSPQQATNVPASELETNSFFNLNYYGTVTPDAALWGAGGSSYAQANRNRILSDAIPALTLPIGANPITAPGIVIGNFDMMTLENSWPQGRLNSDEHNNNWYHSDFHQVAYTFTHNLYDEMVTLGNLK